jgi:hypothetical protein
MKACCAKTIYEIQDKIESFKVLSVMLKAAPCVVLSPEIPLEKDALVEFVLRLIVDHGIELLVEGLPDAKDVIAQLTPLMQEVLQDLVASEVFLHKGGPDHTFWVNANAIYGGGRP